MDDITYKKIDGNTLQYTGTIKKSDLLAQKQQIEARQLERIQKLDAKLTEDNAAALASINDLLEKF